MTRIRMPAIREIKGDSEIPATIKVDNGIIIGQSPEVGWFRVLITEASQESKSALESSPLVCLHICELVAGAARCGEPVSCGCQSTIRGGPTLRYGG